MPQQSSVWCEWGGAELLCQPHQTRTITGTVHPLSLIAPLSSSSPLPLRPRTLCPICVLEQAVPAALPSPPALTPRAVAKWEQPHHPPAMGPPAPHHPNCPSPCAAVASVSAGLVPPGQCHHLTRAPTTVINTLPSYPTACTQRLVSPCPLALLTPLLLFPIALVRSLSGCGGLEVLELSFNRLTQTHTDIANLATDCPQLTHIQVQPHIPSWQTARNR